MPAPIYLVNLFQTTIPAKVKVVAQVDELKAPPLASSWSSGGDSDDPTSSSTATLPQHISEPLPQPEGEKAQGKDTLLK